MSPDDTAPAQVAALIVNSADQYLLHLRDNAPGAIVSPGTWSLLGGAREHGETPQQAIARELAEEVGIDVRNPAAFTLSARTGPGGVTREAVQVFLVPWDGDAAALPLTEGVMCHWFTAEQTTRLLLDPGTAAVIDHHQDRAPASTATALPQLAVPKAAARFTVPLDVHAVLLRPGAAGVEVLLTRRAGGVYASGLWHMPSGHVDGSHEDIVEALVREAHEETGVVIAPEDVNIAATIHHRSPQGSSRVGVFGTVRAWTGVPHIREPHLCSGMAWYPIDRLPPGMVAYPRAGLEVLRARRPFGIHFQQPYDSVAHDPAGPDRLRILGPVTALGGPDQEVPDAS